jgi:hypothetical protein
MLRRSFDIRKRKLRKLVKDIMGLIIFILYLNVISTGKSSRLF